MGVLQGDRNHQGKIYVVSRRCLFVLTHQSTKLYPAFLTPDTPPQKVWGLLRRMRREVQIAVVQAYDGRSVIKHGAIAPQNFQIPKSIIINFDKLIDIG
jgi:hypothetical protein